MSEALAHVELYTDGACSGNPGPGGWAYILRHADSGSEKEASGGDPSTTNNRMELMTLDELRQIHQINYHWIRGHNEHPENERCDRLAVAAIEQFRRTART